MRYGRICEDGRGYVRGDERRRVTTREDMKCSNQQIDRLKPWKVRRLEG
jgi:hypothetical protein